MADQNNYYPQQPQYIDPQAQAAQPVPPQGYAVPPQGYVAPPQGYAVPPQGYAAPPQGYAVPPQGYAMPPQGYAQPQYYAPAPAPVYDAPAPAAEPEVIVQEVGFADYGFGEGDSVSTGHDFGSFMDDDMKETDTLAGFDAFNTQTPNFDPAEVEAASKAATAEEKAMFTSTTTNYDLAAVEAAAHTTTDEDRDIFSNSLAVGAREQTVSDTPAFDAATAAFNKPAEPAPEVNPAPPVFEAAPAAPAATSSFMASMQSMFSSMNGTEAPAAPVPDQSTPRPEPVEAVQTPVAPVAPTQPAPVQEVPAAPVTPAQAPAQATPVVFVAPPADAVVNNASGSATVLPVAPEDKTPEYWNNIDKMLENFEEKPKAPEPTYTPTYAAPVMPGAPAVAAPTQPVVPAQPQPAPAPVQEEKRPFLGGVGVTETSGGRFRDDALINQPLKNEAPVTPTQTIPTPQAPVAPVQPAPAPVYQQPVVPQAPVAPAAPVVPQAPVAPVQPAPAPVYQQPAPKKGIMINDMSTGAVTPAAAPAPAYAAPVAPVVPAEPEQKEDMSWLQPQTNPEDDKRAAREAARAERDAARAAKADARAAEKAAKAEAKAAKKAEKEAAKEAARTPAIFLGGTAAAAAVAEAATQQAQPQPQPQAQPEVVEEKAEKPTKKPTGFKGFLYRTFPNRDDSVGEIIRKCIAVISAIALIVCAIYFLSTFLGSKSNAKDANKLADMMSSSENSEAAWEDIYARYPNINFPSGMQAKFADIYAMNTDLVGWIRIPGLGIDYPVVQTTDDSYYLKHDFNKQSSAYGTIFLSASNNYKEDLDLNTVVYGHAMRRDKQMFSRLHDYKDSSAFVKNPIIEFNTLYKNYKFKVYCAFITNGSSAQDNGYLLDYTFTNLSSTESYASFVAEINQRKLYSTGVDILPSDKIITLSTCSYEFDNARLVVIGRLLREGESEEIDESKVKASENPRYPQAWYDANKKSNPYASYSHWKAQ